MSKTHWCVWIAGIVVITMIIRVLIGWPLAFAEGEETPRLLGVDSYYHLRHVQNIACSFPGMDRTESVTAYPEVVESDAIGCFQWILGGVVRAFGGGAETALWVCALSGPVLAGLSAAAFAVFLRRVFGRGLSVTLSWFLVFYPGTFLDRTLFGFCDHHGLEVLLLTLLGLGLVVVLGRSKWGIPSFAIVGALLIFSWKGAPLYLMVTFAAAGATAFWFLFGGRLPQRAFLNWGLLAAAIFLISASVALVIPTAVIPDSLFTLSMVGLLVVAAFFLLLATLSKWISPAILGSIFLLGVAVIVWLVMALAPDLVATMHFALNPKSPMLSEHLPITLKSIWQYAGPLPIFSLLGLAVCGLRFRLIQVREVFSALFWLLVLGLWMRTRDYGYSASLGWVFLGGFFWHWVWRLLMVQSRVRYHKLAWACILILMTASLLGGSRVLGPFRSPLYYSTIYRLSQPMLGALNWLQGVSERDGGIWAHWSHGNLLPLYADWPAVRSRSPDGEFLLPLLESDESKARNTPIRGRPFRDAIRYFVVDADAAFTLLPADITWAGKDPAYFLKPTFYSSEAEGLRPLAGLNDVYRQTILGRMFWESGSGLGHFRLVYASPEQAYNRFVSEREGIAYPRSTLLTKLSPESVERARSGGWRGQPVYDRVSESWESGGRILPAVQIFEQVKGAIVVIPDTGLHDAEASLTLKEKNSGQTWTYRQRAKEEDGSLVFRLPYAQDSADGFWVIPSGPYRIRMWFGDGRESELPLELSSSDVREGRRVEIKMAREQLPPYQ